MQEVHGFLSRWRTISFTRIFLLHRLGVFLLNLRHFWEEFLFLGRGRNASVVFVLLEDVPRNKVSWNYTFQKTKFRFLRCSKIKNIMWTNNGFPFRAYQGLRIKETNNRFRVVGFVKSKIRARRQAIWNYAIRVFSEPLLSAHDPFPPSHFNPIFSTHSQGYTNFPQIYKEPSKVFEPSLNVCQCDSDPHCTFQSLGLTVLIGGKTLVTQGLVANSNTEGLLTNTA